MGTILISFGYNYKLKIDFIILFLLLLIYIGKIFWFYFYALENEMYSTLYFYLYGYGARMTNPIYNLPSFLMGMYFGMINYSIQRGIVPYQGENSDSYEQIMLLKKNEDKKEAKFNDEEQLNLYEPSESDISSQNTKKKLRRLTYTISELKNKYYSSKNEDLLSNNDKIKISTK